MLHTEGLLQTQPPDTQNTAAPTASQREFRALAAAMASLPAATAFAYALSAFAHCFSLKPIRVMEAALVKKPPAPLRAATICSARFLPIWGILQNEQTSGESAGALQSSPKPHAIDSSLRHQNVNDSLDQASNACGVEEGHERVFQHIAR